MMPVCCTAPPTLGNRRDRGEVRVALRHEDACPSLAVHAAGAKEADDVPVVDGVAFSTGTTNARFAGGFDDAGWDVRSVFDPRRERTTLRSGDRPPSVGVVAVTGRVPCPAITGRFPSAHISAVASSDRYAPPVPIERHEAMSTQPADASP